MDLFCLMQRSLAMITKDTFLFSLYADPPLLSTRLPHTHLRLVGTPPILSFVCYDLIPALMHQDSHQRKYPLHRRLLIGLSMKASCPACRINEYLLAIKSLAANALFLLGDQPLKKKVMHT